MSVEHPTHDQYRQTNKPTMMRRLDKLMGAWKDPSRTAYSEYNNTQDPEDQRSERQPPKLVWIDPTPSDEYQKYGCCGDEQKWTRIIE